MNVPPGQVENLLQELDIRLVFTAHPTEIVRHTVRHKQRRVAHLLQRLQSRCRSPVDEDNLRRQLEEEIRLWWRTDEHQFKPTVWMRWTRPSITSSRCCSRVPAATALTSALSRHYPDVQFPRRRSAPSAAGPDRTGTATLGDPEITWRTACHAS